LLLGKEAASCFRKGIELMLNQRDQLRNVQGTALEELNNQVSDAFCSMAEIYLTDDCFDENAEEECDRLLTEALKYSQNNPEPYQTLASVRISQQNTEEALKLLTTSYNLWKDNELEDLPSYEFRHTTAKLFLEIEQYKIAAHIWEELLDEDDNIAEIHYHLALAYQPISTAASTECLTKAYELLNTDSQSNPGEVKELLQLVEQLRAQLKLENIELDNEDELEDGGDDYDDDDEHATTSQNVKSMDVVSNEN